MRVAVLGLGYVGAGTALPLHALVLSGRLAPEVEALPGVEGLGR